ncbi:MAG TPA: ATP-binding cassette domain-containing protein [bacterium]|nr:ATP-binding cassette domain-containing protein [bacterium]
MSSGAGDAFAAVIECRGLTRRFGDRAAVNDVSFEVRPGELFGLLGPNGAGKTTTHRVLTTTLEPTAGTAKVAGFDVVRDARRVRDLIGVVFQEPALDDRLTARENLHLHAVLYGLRPRIAGPRIQEALEWAGLSEHAGRPVRTFSGGMKRRLELARALLHEPRVLFLDEPTAGLDPQARRRLWDQISTLRRGGLTAFVTTHNMQEAEACDRVAIIDDGRLLAIGAPAALKTRIGGRDRATLEDVFLDLTGRALRDDEATPRERLLGFGRRGGELTR